MALFESGFSTRSDFAEIVTQQWSGPGWYWISQEFRKWRL